MKSGDSRYLWLAAAAVLGLAVRLGLLAASPEALLSRYGSDDLFYYTRVAESLASGHGFTFDGEHPTTGVQPLFTLLLAGFVPFFRGRPEMALTVDLLLVTLLTLVTGFLLPRAVTQLLKVYPTAGKLGEEGAADLGVLVGCVWLLHPRILVATFDGTEGALAGFCWTLSLLLWARDDGSPGAATRLGFSLGLGILARVDHALLLLAFVLFLPRNLPTSRWKRALRIGATSFLVILPWLAVELSTTGSLLPDSGSAKRTAYERIFAEEVGAPVAGFRALRYPWPRAARLLPDLKDAVGHELLGTGGRLSRATLALALAALLLALALPRARSRLVSASTFSTLRAVTRTAAPFHLAAFGLVPVYVVVLYRMRMWYLVPAILALTLLAAALAGDVAARLRAVLPSRARLLVLPAIGVIWLIFAGAEELLTPRDRFLSAHLQAARRAATLTPDGARIGAFNAGVLGAFCGPAGRVVVNLDGVVNHSALEALRGFRLTSYIRQERIEFVVDYIPSLRFFDRISAPGLMSELELLSEVPVRGSLEGVGIFRVRPPALGP
ncbi:MAG: hypothetical protein ACHQPI_12540 [Thermoanaerobaculia bacterium]